MTTRDEINKVWRDFFVQVVGMPQAVKFQQNAPLPEEPVFVTVRIRSSNDIGWNSVANADDLPIDVNEIIYGERYYFAELNFYKKDSEMSAFDYADITKYHIQSNAGYEFLRDRNVAYTDQTEILDLTALESGDFEERAQLTIRFNFTQAISNTVTEIESAHVSGTFEDADVIYPIEKTIEFDEA